MLACRYNPKKNLVITHARGSVLFQDHPPLARAIRQIISKRRKVRWLWIGEDFTGWSLKYLIWNGAFDLWHTFHFEKIAIVGNQKRIRWMARLIKPFTPARVKYFRLEEHSEYNAWIRK